jgi:hypothetical protein
VIVDMVMRNVLSLGAGRQSSCLFAMSCDGLLPKLDAAVFADTQSEQAAVYRQLDLLAELGAKSGIPLIRVTRGDLGRDSLDFRRNRVSQDGKRYASVPVFVKNADGSRGIVRRQCTSAYKIEPIEEWIKRILLKIAPRHHAPRTVQVRCWHGISADEEQRTRFPGRFRSRKETSLVQKVWGWEEETVDVEEFVPDLWKSNAYPFCDSEFFPDQSKQQLGWLKRWTVEDCQRWLAKRFPGVDWIRSACVFCPYRRNAEWKRMRDTDPEAFADACQYDDDQRIADASYSERRPLAGLPFLHDSLVPLRMVKLDSEDDWQLGFANECEGMCGL